MKLAGAYINDETYGRLVALAAANNRTLAGECRHLFDRALRGELPVPEGPSTLPRQQHKPLTQAAGMQAAAPWQPSAAMPQGRTQPPRVGSFKRLRAASRVLAALKAGPLPGAPVNPPTVADAARNAQAAVTAAPNPRLAADDTQNPSSVTGAMQNPLPDAPLCSQMVGNTTQHPQPAAGAGLNPPPVTEAAMAEAAPHGGLRGCENVPVAGVGVVMRMPVGTGKEAAPALWPATGLPRPVRSAFYTRPGGGDEDGNGDEDGEEDGEEVGDDARRNDACIFQTNPKPMPNTNPNHPRPCLHTTPSPLPHTAPQDAGEPRNPARRMPR